MLIRSEIEAILTLIVLNRYAEGISEVILNLEAGRYDAFLFRATRSYTKIFDANLSELGFLDSALQPIVNFYALVSSVMEDKDELEHRSKSFFAHFETNKAQILDLMLTDHRALKQKLEDVSALGKQAISALETMLAELDE